MLSGQGSGFVVDTSDIQLEDGAGFRNFLPMSSSNFETLLLQCNNAIYIVIQMVVYHSFGRKIFQINPDKNCFQ